MKQNEYLSCEEWDAAVSAQPSEWPTIDTAPRDGTPILAYDSLAENATAIFISILLV